ncbi:carbohydrate ABC transporter permease [Novisyntrophococcus fermenticellae]|uniref:carbohydrate ABC transporter permease n=1 Tax=Novisyntrophococcus fermenticellae TaxID=2068655 RepID=UPI001E58AAA8|nr:sugar ABC transporter permease [Novisyntrophococcus fermenticellae]
MSQEGIIPHKKKINWGMIGFTIPIVFLYSFLFLIPILIGFYYSLTNWNGLSSSYKVVGLSNYIKIFKDARFLNSIKFNVVYMVLLVILTLAISMAVALMINRIKFFSTLFRSIYFLPAVLSLVTVGLIWNELFYRVIPVIGQKIGVEWLSGSMLGNPKLAMYAILIVNLWQGCAVPVMLLIAGLQGVPSELYEAATIDGAGPFARFKNITIPFLIPVINMIIITQTKAGLTIFDYIKAMTDGGPGRATEAVGLLIYKYALLESKYSQSVTISMVLFAVVGLISFFTLRLTSSKQVGEE